METTVTGASTEPGVGWADAVSKILKMGTKNPTQNRILSKAKMDEQEEAPIKSKSPKTMPKMFTKRLKAGGPADINESELKSIATRGVVQLFNAVRSVNPNSDKKSKKRKRKKKKNFKRTK